LSTENAFKKELLSIKKEYDMLAVFSPSL